MDGQKLGVFLIILCTVKQLLALEDTSVLSKDTLQSQFGIIESVGMVFRHGDREPIKLYPTDPYHNYVFPFDLGQLTNKGKERAFDLGRYFKPRYTCITGTSYHPSNVRGESSTTDRCLMSGELFYAGYFPPHGKEIWNPNIAWQPIPVHSAPYIDDNVIEISKPCPRLDQLKEDFYATSPLIKKVCAEYQDMFTYIEKFSGLILTPCRNETSIKNLLSLQDNLLVESDMNLKLPEWTKSVFPEPLNSLQILLGQVEVQNPKIFRLSSGPLLDVLISDMLNIAHLNNSFPTNIYTSDASKTPPFHLFSGHDFNIKQLMRGLDVYPDELINFSASLSFEMRKRDQTNYVTLVFQNSLHEPPMTLNIPRCNGSCTLQDFVSVVTPLIPENWEAECNLDYDGKTSTSSPQTSSQSSTSTSDDPPISWSVTDLPLKEKWTPPGQPPNRSDESGQDESESDQNQQYANSINNTDF